MTLRSNYEPGTSRWATRRAMWLALGLSDEDMVKPKIAIVNSSSQLAICFSHLDEVARRAKRAIELAGGVGFEVRTAAPSDFITSAGHRGGYILSARDLIPNDIEVQVEGAQLDGMICLASCDKTAPGQLMAAARLNIPTIIVACGYQASGSYRGRHCDIEDVFLAAGHVANGRVSVEELTEMSEQRGAQPRRVRGLRHREHDAPGLRGARHGAAGLDPGAGEQRADVAGGRRGRGADRRAGRRGPEAAGHHDPGGIPQRGHDHLVGQRLDQLGQAPAGGGGRGRGGRRRVPAVRDARRRRAAAERDQAQRRDAHRGVRGRGRDPRAHEAAGRAPRHRRPHGLGADRRGEPGRRRGRGRRGDQAAGAGTRAGGPRSC